MIVDLGFREKVGHDGDGGQLGEMLTYKSLEHNLIEDQLQAPYQGPPYSSSYLPAFSTRFLPLFFAT
jgi:hypothetical protein